MSLVVLLFTSVLFLLIPFKKGVPDKLYLEEQVKELMHQNRKLTEELLQVKLQLTATEEQNDTLQADLERIARRLSS